MGRASAAAGAVTAITVCASDVQPERVSWLWNRRIPLGKLSILEGDPGLGQSTLALGLAASISIGRALPDDLPLDRSATLLCTAEDGLADTVVPRLMAAGADVGRIHFWTGVRQDEREDPPSFPEHCLLLLGEIRRVAAVLVVVDPLMAYLAPSVNSWRDHDVRQALFPLAQVADVTGAAVLIIRHLTKGTGPAIYRGGGSIGLGAAV